MQSAPTRIAIVTGGSRGIGRDIAMQFAAQGCDVVIGYHGRADVAIAVVRDIEKLGRAALAVQGNVAEQSDVEALFDAALARFGRIELR
jgi:3-oxoacyl-[acyl-carrier protein] reductase